MAGFDAQFGRELLLQIKCIAVGVEIDVGEGLMNRGHGEWRGPKRVFIGRNFDDGISRQIQFAGDFLDGTARLVYRQIFEKRI